MDPKRQRQLELEAEAEAEAELELEQEDQPPSRNLGLADAFMSGIPFRDEIAAAGGALGKKTLTPLLNAITGANIPVGSLGEEYSKELGMQREGERQLREELPTTSLAASLLGGAALPVKAFGPSKGVLSGLLNTAKTTAQGAGLGALYGFGAGEGSEDRLGKAASSAALGGALSGGLDVGVKALRGLGGVAGSAAKSGKSEIVGYRPDAKTSIGGYLDSAGNITDDVMNATEQVSKKDIKLKDLEELGFFNKLKAESSQKNAALELSKFRKRAGDDIGEVINEALEKESALAPWKRENIINETAPDFSDAVDFVAAKVELKEPGAAALSKRLTAVQKAWEKSGQTVKEFKKLQKEFGVNNSKSFNKSNADTNSDTLNNILYGSIAQSLKKRISAIDEELLPRFTEANKKYSASVTFEQDAFNAARKVNSEVPILGKSDIAGFIKKSLRDPLLVPATKAAGGISNIFNYVSPTEDIASNIGPLIQALNE